MLFFGGEHMREHRGQNDKIECGIGIGQPVLRRMYTAGGVVLAVEYVRECESEVRIAGRTVLVKNGWPSRYSLTPYNALAIHCKMPRRMRVPSITKEYRRH